MQLHWFVGLLLTPLVLAANDQCKGSACNNENNLDTSADAAAMLQFAAVSRAVGPEKAVERDRTRQRLMVEKDLAALFKQHASKGPSGVVGAGKQGPESCFKQAQRVFDDVVQTSVLAKELRDNELSAFKQRFASAMKGLCKEIDSEEKWLEVGAVAFEQQKPLMTEALSSAINKAGLGFKTKMKDWLLHESVASFPGRLGLLPTPEGAKSVFKRRTAVRHTEDLPEIFRAEMKWPECEEQILRIHNQGHCGSCWAFGGTAAIDARMCIASNGTWNGPKDILSRLHVTSCAPDVYSGGGSDGCQGGWPHWPMEYMALHGGVVSSSCLPYYIGGEGSEHFEQRDTAPPCETHCQDGYSLEMSQDLFSSAGVGNYDWLAQVHGDPEKIGITKAAIYLEGPVSFCFYANSPFMGYTSGVFSVCTGEDRANHAVYTYGWGKVSDADGEDVEFFEASNSWGSDWGDNGHFRIHPRCMTDVTIPGTIEADVVSHSVGVVNSSVPPDAENEDWPWRQPEECPYEDGCVTDLEGNESYADNELCVSKALEGRALSVVEFDTEYGYDFLTVNGMSFSGKEGSGLNVAQLEGLVVDSNGIQFKSDVSVTGPGFKLCAVDPPECPFEDGCVTDLEGNETYADNELCTSKALVGHTITIVEFETESGYDIVTVNGVSFSGKEGAGLDVDSLEGLVVDSEGIKFHSDFSLVGLGFKLCSLNITD